CISYSTESLSVCQAGAQPKPYYPGNSSPRPYSYYPWNSATLGTGAKQFCAEPAPLVVVVLKPFEQHPPPSYAGSNTTTTQVTLSREPRFRSSSTTSSTHSCGSGHRLAPCRRSSSLTWLVSPSLASKSRSPGRGESGLISAPSLMPTQPRNLCKTCCQGLWRASSAVRAPLATRAWATGWSTVSCSTFPPRTREARLSPLPATNTPPAPGVARNPPG